MTRKRTSWPVEEIKRAACDVQIGERRVPEASLVHHRPPARVVPVEVEKFWAAAGKRESGQPAQVCPGNVRRSKVVDRAGTNDTKLLLGVKQHLHWRSVPRNRQLRHLKLIKASTEVCPPWAGNTVCVALSKVATPFYLPWEPVAVFAANFANVSDP